MICAYIYIYIYDIYIYDIYIYDMYIYIYIYMICTYIYIYDVRNPIQNMPFWNGLHNPTMLILGMVCGVGFTTLYDKYIYILYIDIYIYV